MVFKFRRFLIARAESAIERPSGRETATLAGPADFPPFAKMRREIRLRKQEEQQRGRLWLARHIVGTTHADHGAGKSSISNLDFQFSEMDFSGLTLTIPPSRSDERSTDRQPAMQLRHAVTIELAGIRWNRGTCSADPIGDRA